MASLELRHRHDNPRCCTAIGDQIHNGDGIELHRQHLHGDAAEFFRLRVHLPVFKRIRLINFQRG